jgi:hypothetical protein
MKETLGDPMTFSPAVGSPISLVGVISDPIPPETRFPGVNTQVKIFVEDLGAVVPARGDAVSIGAVNYKVFDIIERRAAYYLLALRKHA